MLTPWAKQRASRRNNQSSQTKPVYENPNPRRFSSGEIIWDGVKDFGQAIVSCLENLANEATLESYNLLEINARDVNQDYLPQKNNFNTNNAVPRY